jgi:hypothetical protein
MTTHRPPGDDLPRPPDPYPSGVHADAPRRRVGGAQGDLPPGPRDAAGLLRRVRDRARWPRCHETRDLAPGQAVTIVWNVVDALDQRCQDFHGVASRPSAP